MKFVNLTPHAIKEVNSGKTFPPSGQVARVKVDYKKVTEIDGIPMYKAVYGQVEGIPEKKSGVIYIVSGLVFEAANRKDVVAPGNLVRDAQGRPTGCDGFKLKI